MTSHDNVYDGLLGSDDAHWAFGGDDPADADLGVDGPIPDGLDAGALADLCLALGDDALVLSHRLSQWCSNAPDLEDDVALANIALDLLGQARMLLGRAAAADPSRVPALPAGSPIPAEDALAFFRDADAFRCAPVVELDNGDFAQTVVRLLLVSATRLTVLSSLRSHADPVLAAIAASGVVETSYHRDHAARWFVTLARGTEESRRRLVAGLAVVWPFHLAHAAGLDGGPDVGLAPVFEAAGVDEPAGGAVVAGHTEALSRMLAEMQVVARAHPMGVW